MPHPEHPLEQRVRSDHFETQSLLLRLAWQRPPPASDTLFVGVYGGLRVLARHEPALQAATRGLQRRCEGRLVLDAPAVRYVHATPVLEPWMHVVVTGPVAHRPVVERDLRTRRGEIGEATTRGDLFTLEGEARLADLLGYAAWLQDATGATCRAQTTLSRYRPLDNDDDDDGPRAA